MNILTIPFVGAYELRKQLHVLLAKLKKQEESIVVTQKGKPAGVLMSVKKYVEMNAMHEELEEALKDMRDVQYMTSLIHAVDEVKKGKGTPAGTLFAELGL